MRPDLAALRMDTPPVVTALMQQCWAQDYKCRPSALHVAQAFDALLSGLGSITPALSTADDVANAQDWEGNETPRVYAAGGVWAAAEAGDLAGLKVQLVTGGCIDEVDSVRWFVFAALPHPLPLLLHHLLHRVE